ncbi:suppressor of rasval19 [Polyrhizophydium stewartii]|uniref:Adenylyl cyclase-associated protein n=1 Tax=Polyrhizophydium stewartii TaxID=2732419 RepID=A0ABR4N602_9FUNG
MSADAQLSAVIQRLEAATLRLETLARTGSAPSVALAAAPPGAGAPAAAAGGAASPALAAFDSLVHGALKTFLDASAAVGDLVEKQAGEFKAAIDAERRLIEIASQAKKPDAAALQDLIKPLQTAIGKVVEIKDKNRPSPLFFHLSAVADGIGALGWVVVEPTPVPYIGELKDAAQFYANRVIKDFKEKGKHHVEWVQAYTGFLGELQAYVKQWHTTGLSWNPRGGDAKSVAAAGGPAPAAGAAPPPPPPLPTAAQLEAFGGGPSGAAAPAGAGALFSEISKGNVTAGLRKVDKSEMTHKNPELRATSVVKASEAPAPRAAAAPAAAAAKPPKLALEGNKWVVENQMNQSGLVIEGTEIRHTVYIYNCHNTTIHIKGKVNAVTIDNSKKVGVLIESVVSTIDIVNGKSVQVQVTGRAPTVNIDKTDGFQLYLSKTAVDVEVFSAKSSEMNILIEGEDGEYTERPVPEQFKTVIRGNSLLTETVEHKG